MVNSTAQIANDGIRKRGGYEKEDRSNFSVAWSVVPPDRITTHGIIALYLDRITKI